MFSRQICHFLKCPHTSELRFNRWIPLSRNDGIGIVGQELEIGFRRQEKLVLPVFVFGHIAGCGVSHHQSGPSHGHRFHGRLHDDVKFSNPVTQDVLRTELTRIGQVDATVQSFGDNTYFIRTRQLSDQDKDSLVNTLEASLSPDGVDVSSDFVLRWWRAIRY